MSKQKLTPWFPAGVKPERIGVYNTLTNWSSDKAGAFQYWDGKQFRCTDRNPEGAYRDRDHTSRYKLPKWRGLTSDPNA